MSAGIHDEPASEPRKACIISRVRTALIVTLLAACYSPSPTPGAPCTTSRECPDGLVCSATNTCEKSGAGMTDSGTDACPSSTCDGDDLVGCGDRVTCANGCGGSTPHCLQLAPANGVTPALLVDVTADLTTDKMKFDTDDGSIRVMNTDIRPPGEGLMNGVRFQIIDGAGVFAARSFSLVPGEEWLVSGSRPIVLYAATTITLAADIDVGAGFGGVGGPGATGRNGSTGVGGCRGRAGRGIDSLHGEGGGGGGGAAGVAGGNGGPSNQGGTFTGVGGTCPTNPSTIPLRGGNGGGDGGDSSSNFGGGGGGAIALVAMESVTITAEVAAPGGGGGSLSTGNGGGGGGGGGAILIEAPTVTITGPLTANGGGGGAPSGGSDGSRGSKTSATPALGGNYTGSGGPARGGNGGAGTTVPTNGASYNFNDAAAIPPTNTNRGGGGGGAAGLIEVRRRAGAVTGLTSPPAAINAAAFE